MQPNSKLVEALLPAYRPCARFGTCKEAVWKPEVGHVPRGFLGATGGLSDVKLVMIFAEPGGVYPEDDYSNCVSPEAILSRAVEETYRIFSSGTDQFHRNARWFLDQIWPNLNFEEQLRHVWMTEGRLCSIAEEIRGFTDRVCAPTYLKHQLDLLSSATVVPFGGKARDRTALVSRRYVRGVYSLSPPGANQGGAKPSWESAISLVRNSL